MATKAKGTKFKIGTTAYDVYRITPPQFERGEVDITTLSDDYKTKDPGEVIEVTDMEVELVYTDAMNGTLKTAAENATTETMSVVYADSKGWTGPGFVKKFGQPEIADGGKLTISVTIGCAGEWNQITAG